MGDVWSNRGVSPFRENCVIQAKLPGQSRFSRMAEEDSRGPRAFARHVLRQTCPELESRVSKMSPLISSTPNMKKQASSPARGANSTRGHFSSAR